MFVSAYVKPAKSKNQMSANSTGLPGMAGCWLPCAKDRYCLLCLLQLTLTCHRSLVLAPLLTKVWKALLQTAVPTFLTAGPESLYLLVSSLLALLLPFLQWKQTIAQLLSCSTFHYEEQSMGCCRDRSCNLRHGEAGGDKKQRKSEKGLLTTSTACWHIRPLICTACLSPPSDSPAQLRFLSSCSLSDQSAQCVAIQLCHCTNVSAED